MKLENSLEKWLGTHFKRGLEHSPKESDVYSVGNRTPLKVLRREEMMHLVL